MQQATLDNRMCCSIRMHAMHYLFYVQMKCLLFRPPNLCSYNNPIQTSLNAFALALHWSRCIETCWLALKEPKSTTVYCNMTVLNKSNLLLHQMYANNGNTAHSLPTCDTIV